MGLDRDRESSSNGAARSESDESSIPLLGGHYSKPLSSQSKMFGNVFIAIMGAGVLGLPYAFKHSGWITSLLTLFLVALLTHHCMMLLVLSRHKLHSSNIFSFGDLGFTVCGSFRRHIIDILIILSQTGFCVGYLIFIENTLANSSSYSIWGLSPKEFFIWSCFLFQLGFNSIATLTHLAPLRIFADVVDLGAVSIVLVNDFVVFLEQRPPVEAFGSFSMFFYSLGVAVYSFEGIGMVLPLESEPHCKDNFGTVLALTM